MSIEETNQKLESLRIEKGRITEAYRKQEIEEEFHNTELARLNEEIATLHNFISSPVSNDENIV